MRSLVVEPCIRPRGYEYAVITAGDAPTVVRIRRGCWGLAAQLCPLCGRWATVLVGRPGHLRMCRRCAGMSGSVAHGARELKVSAGGNT